MKSRISFFNFRVLRKNLGRFAPLWILYAVGEVLGLMSLGLDNKVSQIASDLCYLMGPVAIFHMVYAFLVATCLFGDLFDSRMCNGLHAMPMRRDGWLLTNLVSGLVFALIPAIVGGGVAALFLGEYWWFALVWQGTSLLEFVFFFGLAVFCAMSAGKRLGMFAMYGIGNFLSMLAYWVIYQIFAPLLPGVVLSDYWFAKLCPVINLAGSTYLDFTYDHILGGFFRGYVWENFTYLGVCAAVGLVFLLLSWILYRKRPLEKAGDFIAFRPMGVFFLLSYTFALGVLLYAFGDLLGTFQNYGFLAVGIVIGWFTGWMLLERTVRIFTKKVLLGFVAFLVLFAGAWGLTLVDPLGIAAYIPENQQIATANLYMQGDVYYYEVDEEWGGWHITDPEEIAWVQQLHEDMLSTTVGTGANLDGRNYALDQLRFRLGNLDTSPDECVTIYIRYRLKNGMEVYRTYRIPKQSPTMEKLKPFLSDPRAVFSVTDFEQVKDTVREMNIYWGDKDELVEINTDAQRQALLAAIEADCKAGNMVQHSYFHGADDYVAGIDITWMAQWSNGVSSGSGTRGTHLSISKDAKNTCAFLDSLQ